MLKKLHALLDRIEGVVRDVITIIQIVEASGTEVPPNLNKGGK